MSKSLNEKDLDKVITEGLKDEYKVNELHKETMWNTIESSLEFKKPKKNNAWKKVVSGIAACGILAFGLTSEPGMAMIKEVEQFFAPEKEVVVEIEGMKEEKNVSLKENQQDNYVIYVDEERYKIEKKDGYDIITTKEPLGGNYPEVFMKIKHETTSVEDMATKMQKELNVTFEKVEEPLKSMKAHILAGNEWDSLVHNYYIVSDENGGSYIIQQQYFLEASEGHGTRLDFMLKEFHIIK